jgi:hypothetical protein
LSRLRARKREEFQLNRVADDSWTLTADTEVRKGINKAAGQGNRGAMLPKTLRVTEDTTATDANIFQNAKIRFSEVSTEITMTDLQ